VTGVGVVATAPREIKVHIPCGQSRTETRWRRRQLSALLTISAATALIGYQYANGSDSLSQRTGCIDGRS
jgi:hypothetical protein